MDSKNDKHTTPKQQIEEGIGNAATAAHSVLERGTEVYDHAKQTVSDVYDKTTKAVCKTCEQAKSYTSKNPGKTVLIALGVGLGVGILLGARTHHSRTGRFAQPVVNALSDIALELFR